MKKTNFELMPFVIGALVGFTQGVSSPCGTEGEMVVAIGFL